MGKERMIGHLHVRNSIKAIGADPGALDVTSVKEQAPGPAAAEGIRLYFADAALTLCRQVIQLDAQAICTGEADGFYGGR